MSRWQRRGQVAMAVGWTLVAIGSIVVIALRLA